jgi:hypothetical protein
MAVNHRKEFFTLYNTIRRIISLVNATILGLIIVIVSGFSFSLELIDEVKSHVCKNSSHCLCHVAAECFGSLGVAGGGSFCWPASRHAFVGGRASGLWLFAGG